MSKFQSCHANPPASPFQDVPQPWKELCERSYWVGWSSGQFSKFSDPEFYGIGWAAGNLFRATEILYDLGGGSMPKETIEQGYKGD